jgi:hypothetical protein
MHKDKASPDPNLPPLPVQLYPTGRFMVPVPQGLEMLGGEYKLNQIQIRELNWEKGRDREEYLRSLWQPIRDDAKQNYDDAAELGRAIQGGFAEQDVSSLFGHPAMLLCYDDRNHGYHKIDIHIGLPQFVLRLTEDRAYDVGEECLKMDGPSVKLFKHYIVGHQNLSPESFVTAGGRVEGLKTWAEMSGLTCRRDKTADKPKISYSFYSELVQQPDEAPKSMNTFQKELKMNKIELEMLRSRTLVLADMEGLEEVFIMSDKNEEGNIEADLTASWDFRGEGNNPDKPFVSIEMRCIASAKYDALRMWDAIISNFSTVRDWYAKNPGGK